MPLRAPFSEYDFVPATVAGQAVVVFGADLAPDAPVVVVLHGLGGAHWHLHPRCRELARRGFTVLTYDQRNAGLRACEPRHQWVGVKPGGAPALYGQLVGNARDLSLLLDFLPASLGLPAARVGVIGVSFGGYVTSLAMAHEPRIAVAVSLIGNAHFGYHRELAASRGEHTAAELAAWWPPEMDELEARYSPLHHLPAYADRPFLLLAGEDDTLVPSAGNEAFAAAARPHYAHPERLVCHGYPGQQHQITEPMWQRAFAWFDRWL